MGAAKPSVPTAVAIAIVAYAAADVLHEVAHAIVGWSVGVPIVSISTVALQTAGRSRLVAAAGTSADVLAGGCALLAAARHRFGWSAYFLWLFGFVSLMNIGYLPFSAVTDAGDWAAVVERLEPRWAWRVALAAAGAVGYALATRTAAGVVQRFVDRGDLAHRDIRHLTYPAYLAGGALMTAASLFNPIGPWLILTSGAGASFGLTWGLLTIGGLVGSSDERPLRQAALDTDPRWLVAATIVGTLFVAVLGRGIRI